jgi:hypothetical protein
MSCRASFWRHIHLIGGYRGEPQFCGDRVDSLLRDGQVDPSAWGEVRAYAFFVVLLHFVPRQPVEERAEVVDGQAGLFGDRPQGPIVRSDESP